MFQVAIDGSEVNAEVSFYTAQLYEAEFHADIIKDFFGAQDLSDPIDTDGEKVLSIDFTKINWLAATKVLWAAVKTADDNALSYQSWMKKAKGVNMWLVYEQLSAEVADCFFRSEPA